MKSRFLLYLAMVFMGSFYCTLRAKGDGLTATNVQPGEMINPQESVSLPGLGTAIFRDHGSGFSLQVPIAFRKDFRLVPGSNTNAPVLQVWLFKKDGRVVPQQGRPSTISLGDIGDFSTDYLFYTFSRAPEDELAGVAVILNGKLYYREIQRRGGSPFSAPTAEATNGVQIRQIKMFNTRDGWAEADDRGDYRLLRTTDGAQTWLDATPHVKLPEPYDFWNCEFSKPLTAWATFHTKSSAGLLMTTNGGASWAQVGASFGYFTEASDVHFYKENYGIAEVGDGGMGSEYYTFYETWDGGQNWKLMNLKPPAPYYGDETNAIHLSNINGDRIGYYAPGTFIIAFGDSGDETPEGYVRLAASTDLGQTWREAHLPLPAEWSNGSTAPSLPVFFSARQGILPVEIFKNIGDSRTYFVVLFYATSDGGKTWMVRQPVADTNGMGYADCDIISSKDIVVRSGGVLNVTHDGAKSWHTIKPNLDLGRECAKRDVSEMDFTDARHGWIIISDNATFSPYGNDLFYKTADGGETWTAVPVKMGH